MGRAADGAVSHVSAGNRFACCGHGAHSGNPQQCVVYPRVGVCGGGRMFEAKPTLSRSSVCAQDRFLHNKKHLLSNHSLTNPAPLLLPLSIIGGGSPVCRAKKWGSRGRCSWLFPTGLAASHGSPLVPGIRNPGLEPRLPVDSSAWQLWLEGWAQLLALPSPEVHAALCPAWPT